jgi:RNA polymerase sigma-70 factor (ECF subfamily)
MRTTHPPQGATEATAAVAAATAGDEAAFGALVERYRPELQVHCYRMLGSLEDSEDLVQETFLRAWRHRDQFDGGPGFRAWLYRIATNACLDAIRRKGRRAEEVGSFAEIPWLQPYPDRLLDEVAPRADEPDAVVVARETIELGFLALIQILPARQRAVLILRDVLEFSAQETADALETSVASVNSALQRARAGLKEHLPARRSEWSADASPADRALVARYIEAAEAGDAAGLKAIMADDLRFSMPPEDGMHVGGDAVVDLWFENGFGDKEAFGEVRMLLTFANRQPAVANYVKSPGSDVFVPLALDVLRIADGEIVEVLAFPMSTFAAFGLPETL